MEVSLETVLCDDADQSLLFGRMINYGDWLIFTPLKSAVLLFYNISTHCSYSEVVPKIYYDENKYHFFTGIIYEDSLYLFGYSKCVIVEYNIPKREFKEMTIHADASPCDDEGFFHVNYYRNGDVVYFPFMNCSAVLEFNLLTKERRVHILSNEKYGYITIDRVNDRFIMAPRNAENAKIIEWDDKTNDITSFSAFPMEFDRKKYSFYRTVAMDENIIFFRHASNHSIILNTLSGELKIYEELYEPCTSDAGLYAVFVHVDDKILMMSGKGVLFWDKSTNESEYKTYKPGNDVLDKLTDLSAQKAIMAKYSKTTQDQIIVIESANNKFSEYVSYLTKS